MALAEQHATNAAALKVIVSSLVLICELFYSLNYQVRRSARNSRICELFYSLNYQVRRSARNSRICELFYSLNYQVRRSARNSL